MNARLVLFLCLTAASAGCKKATPNTEGQEKAEGKVDAGEDQEKGDIILSPEALQNAQIEVARAERRPIVRGLTTSARLTYTQSGVAEVSARVPGRIVELKVQLGAQVKKREVLAYLESAELASRRGEYLAALTRGRVAKQNYDRERALLEKGISSEREARAAEEAYAAALATQRSSEAALHTIGLDEAEINALRNDEHYSSRFPARTPLEGTVVEASPTVGAQVDATTHLFTVAKLDQLWALLDVYESQLALVRVGEPVVLWVDAYPDRQFDGLVDYVGDVVEEKTRAVHVRVVVPNKDGVLKPGMFGRAELVTTATAKQTDAGSEEPTGVVVPRAAVQRIGDVDLVFVREAPNRFKPARVRLGKTSAREAEVLSGLEPGAEVVTRGSFTLKAELSRESLGGE